MPISTQTVTIEGLSETAEALDEFSKATSANILRRVLIAAGQPIAATAEALAPRRTGALVASISVVPAQPSKMTRTGRGNYDKQSQVEVLVEAGPVVESITQEFGTRYHRAQPFMRPAWEQQRDAALEIVKQQLSIEIEKSRARAARKAERIAAKIGSS
ncbi:MAG TPA: HK97-gp10 family putative phage morphogenesis protein [Candidatus Cybelea sp.]|nr:HK97-gp10 family putative phage morphogenesis protein [Candidatus Cybelea sp.]